MVVLFFQPGYKPFVTLTAVFGNLVVALVLHLRNLFISACPEIPEIPILHFLAFFC